MRIPNIALVECKPDHYLKAESVDRIRTESRHQGHACDFIVIKCHDDSLHLVPLPTVIAAVHIPTPGEVFEPFRMGTSFKVNVDGITYNIRDDKRGQNPYLEIA